MSDSEDLFSDDIDFDAVDQIRQRNSSTSPDQEYEEITSIPVKGPTHHRIDYHSLEKYIYPTNFEVRDYQYNIVQRAFYDNLLVALPTGLGKTFIASTVMMNFLRWFPDSKIIFMAPTKPLVAQQIKACCGITGIAASKVAILLDKTKKNRVAIWEEKQVFFTTPQVVENDLTQGIVNPKLVVLLVIDEAHRSKGNYAYNNVCKFLRRFNLSFRVLALTATPASDADGVQEVIDNLQISKVEVRTENSIDIIKYMKRKKIEKITVQTSPEVQECIELIKPAIAPVLTLCNERKIYEETNPAYINAFKAMEASQRVIKNPNMPEGLKWSNYFLLQLLNVVGQCLRRLNIYGVRSFYHYFVEKHREFVTKYKNKKSTNHTAADFYMHESITELLEKAKAWVEDKSFLGHPKLEVLTEQLLEFFATKTNDSKVIVFTEFRESALDIVRCIENMNIDSLRPHIFIGQAKEKEKFDEQKFLLKGKGKKDPVKGKRKKKDDNMGNITSSEDAQLNGMNQKRQKELIKKFKQGEFNILVATSIGEEGLDIGEVDLIVCFDSTSSPIKNIQRMGRTGRKRDGKVLLLFASNEEAKFDKAMSGYEYIQLHILSSKQIHLCDRVRIIPKDFKPIVEKKFIELPEENVELKVEEDEDEIIRIAMNYMNKKPVKGKKKKNPPKKVEKKFFMPDDVEQGFVSVISMIKKKGDEIAETRREKDLLDELVDSEGEATQKAHEMSRESADVSAQIGDSSKMEGNTISLDSDEERLNSEKTKSPLLGACEDSILLDSDDDDEILNAINSKNGAKKAPVAKKSFGSKKTTYKVQKSITSLVDYKSDEDSATNSVKRAPIYDSLADRSCMKSLGTKRRKTSILDQLKEQKSKTEHSLSRIFQAIEDTTPTIGEPELDDGLDDEIIRALRATPKDNNVSNSNVSDNGLNSNFSDDVSDNIPKNNKDPLFKNKFDNDEGFLNEEQRFELFTLYFVNLKSSEKVDFYDPIAGINSATRLVGHSKCTQLLSRALKGQYGPIEKLQTVDISRFQDVIVDDDRQDLVYN